jgi:EF-P beta-lysylation protein EpmB
MPEMLETLTPMIPAASPDLQPSPAGAWQDTHDNASPDTRASDWRRLWRDCVSDPRELLDILGLQVLAGRLSDAAAAQFPLRVPRGFVARMRHGDASDPLLRQVLPLDDEERLVSGFMLDAVGDTAAGTATGVLQKYQGRALLIATGACAVHCRYCFRRHFPYAEQGAARDGWADALATIAGDDSVEEVILSGGDPLSLATSKLVELTSALARIPHLKRLRIHTRLPVVLPERVDASLLAWVTSLPWPVTIVIHANHANEIDAAVEAAMGRLRGIGALLLNQSVLLRGVNDSVMELAALSERLHAAGVLPYYLHQLDRVQGAAHFEVDDATALHLHAELSSRLSGYLVPRLVREVAGDPGKRPVLPSSAHLRGEVGERLDAISPFV